MSPLIDRLTGINAVSEALQAGSAIDRVVIARGRQDTRTGEIVQLARGRGIPVRFEDRSQIDRLANTKDHQGVVALAAARAAGSLEDILAHAKSGGHGGLIVLLDGVEDPHNLGAIIRTALAAGAPRVQVQNSDDSQILANGKLTLTDNQVDVNAGSIRLKAEFENKDNVLWPGLAVSTRLEIGVAKNALIVPEAAIQRGVNGLFVFVVDAQNRAVMRSVVVSHEDVDEAVVDKGVNEGERVVTIGQYVLQPGALVAIDAASSTGS